MDSMSEESRIQFFNDALRRLQKASQQGFYSLQSQASVEQTGFVQYYPNIMLQRKQHFSYNQVHKYSQSIWPCDANKDLTPLKSTGDGNCLYRSVSLLCSGNEDNHLEFRARTVCELVLNSSFYLVEDKCSILSIEGAIPITNVLAATSRNFTQVSSHGNYEPDISQLCFQEDCIESCTPDTYANMWEVYGVSSVIGIPVQSVYPEYNKRHRPAFNILIQPRIYRSTPFDETVLTIMWTRLHAPCAPSKTKQWSPNHFVPCVPTTDLISPSQSSHYVKAQPPRSPATAFNYQHRASMHSSITHKSSGRSQVHSHAPYSSCTITTTSSNQTKNVGATSTANVCNVPTQYSEVLKSRPSPVVAGSSCPKLSTILLSKTQCRGKSKNQFTLTSKAKSSPSCNKQSLPFSSSSRPDHTSNDKTQSSDRAVFFARKQQPAYHNSTLPCSEEHHSLNSQLSNPRPLTSISQSCNVLQSFTSNSDIEAQISANKHNPIARPTPFPKMNICSPGLLTILNSKTVSSQQLLPIETFFVTHKAQSHSSVSSSEEVMDTPSQLPPETNIKASADSDADPDEVDSTNSYDSEIEMEIQRECETDFQHKEVMDTSSQLPPETNIKASADSDADPDEVDSTNSYDSEIEMEIHRESETDFQHKEVMDNVLQSFTSISDIQVQTSANKHNPIARPTPFPKMNICSPGLLTILNSKTVSSQQLLPIETFFVTHKAQSHSSVSSSEEVMDTSSQLPPETNIKASADSDADPDEVDSTNSYDSEIEMEIHRESETDFQHNTVVIDESLQKLKPEALEDSGKSTTSQYLQYFPFPLLSLSWYRHRGRLSGANKCRENIRRTNKLQFNKEGKPISLQRSQVQGSLEENIHQLQHLTAISGCARKKRFFRTVICLAEYMKQCGFLVRTQELLDMYYSLNHKQPTTESQETHPTHSRMNASTFYEIIGKYLNIAQIYIDGKAYLFQNTTCDFEKLVETISSAISEQSIVNSHVSEQLQHMYPLVLRYADTERDRQIIKAMTALITSSKFAAKLQGIKNRTSITRAVNCLPKQLTMYENLIVTSQSVRNDMTTEQQYRLYHRTIEARKIKEIRTNVGRRGRYMKIEEFPELAQVLEYAFGERDIRENDGGGLESHPRLTDGTLYKSLDNYTNMIEARELVLALSPADFSITLSSCYNYTQNYKEGTYQAKRHHANMGVNANLSLHDPPRIGVPQFVINLHWTTANVNYLADYAAENEEEVVVISKDAKAIVPANITPVQKPGRTWRNISHPDHTWEQGRRDAVTPMTFLFLETIPNPISTDHHPVYQITRTGKAVTLINLSLYEPETVFRCFNELFLLLANPTLDKKFRNSCSGNLKSEMIFIVDNGPSEMPSSYLVQMCLVRLVKFMKLRRAIQVSYAEYHSKRNFVERVHSAENEVLSKHGPFDGKRIHQDANPWSEQHKENMEAMAQDVAECISHAKFGGSYIVACRGVQTDQNVFNDEQLLRTFLALTEERKNNFTETYKPSQSGILSTLVDVWGVDEKFEGSYLEDYQTLRDQNTCFLDKYTAIVYNNSISADNAQPKQPLPDYLHWFQSDGELHYLSFQNRKQLSSGPWDTCAGLFIPSKILDLAYKVLRDPPVYIIKFLALLAWVPESDVQRYFDNQTKEECAQLKNDQLVQQWSQHSLYKMKKKDELERMCRDQKITVTPNATKHELVKCISESKKETPPELPILYNGSLQSVPSTLPLITKLSVRALRAILHTHGVLSCGNKDELAIRVYLLKHGKTNAIFGKEKRAFEDLIKMCQELTFTELQCYISTTVTTTRRTFRAVHPTPRNLQGKIVQSVEKPIVKPPDNIHLQEDLTDLFNPLLQYLHTITQVDKQNPVCTASTTQAKISKYLATLTNTLHHQITQTGSIIKVKWTKNEIGNTGWRPGWYKAQVQSYCIDTDEVELVYTSEPTCIYTLEVTPAISSEIVKLVKPYH